MNRDWIAVILVLFVVVFSVAMFTIVGWPPTTGGDDRTSSEAVEGDVGLGLQPLTSFQWNPQHSAARNWNEVLLEAIRSDLARPTVHARNLFHSSAAMFDIWSLHKGAGVGYFVDNALVPAACAPSASEREDFRTIGGDNAATGEAISHFMYQFIGERFAQSPGASRTERLIVQVMGDLGYGLDDDGVAVDTGSDAQALGSFMADCVSAFAEVDGSNQNIDYANLYYEPVNEPMWPDRPSTELMADPNRWQPLNFEVFVDQSGNAQSTPGFVGAEWDAVVPFALIDLFDVMPDPPSQLTGSDGSSTYQDGHSLVALWSAHLDHTDGVSIDISPASLGDSPWTDLRYERQEGGTDSAGRPTNPTTGAAYPPNIVQRGDFTRVVAEFWADGPDSETPPGHWFSILNEMVTDHPATEKRLGGNGQTLSDLEWDLYAYLTLGGAMHDAAIAAWGAKATYDSARPISAIRHMALLGQSTEPDKADYHPQGLPLVPGHIERIGPTDTLAGLNGIDVGALKILAWDTPGRRTRPGETLVTPGGTNSNVRWVLASAWVPYQRPTFVTPPFAGYVSGHSTFSRAAAEVLTWLTGDEFFPGGLGEFVARQNDFLVFEQGPSTDITLQWATYGDAADQSGLSRIWGGIHPPEDDQAGRIMGAKVADGAIAAASLLIDGTPLSATPARSEPRPTPDPDLANDRSDDGPQTRWYERALVRLAWVATIVLLYQLWKRWRHRRSQRSADLRGFTPDDTDRDQTDNSIDQETGHKRRHGAIDSGIDEVSE